MHEAVIVSAVRTAAGKAPGGTLRGTRPDELGAVAIAAGDLDAARAAYQASLDIAARLAATDPTNTGWQRDLQLARKRLDELDGKAPDDE